MSRRRKEKSGESKSSPDDEASRGSAILGADGKVCPDQLRRAAGSEDQVSIRSVDSNEVESDDDGALTVRFHLARDLQKRLDKYLQDRIPFMSRSQLQRLIKEEAVTVNGRIPKPSTILRMGDEISVIVPPPPTSEIPPEEIPLEILFEDEHLIVLNKQDDIIVHPARGNKTGTIINALAWHFKYRTSGSLSDVGKEHVRPGVVHRLDRHTTGALIAAKTDVAHWRLGKQFADRTTDKRYLAIVVGKVEPSVDTVDLPIGKHPRVRELMAVRYDDTAKEATTVYRLREQFDGFALVELELRTGRTHQIRVHLSSLGWPIVGDDLYNGPLLDLGDVVPGQAGPSEPLMHRQCLHACSIAFQHPLSDQRMEFQAPLPADYLKLLRILRTHRSLQSPIAPPGSKVDLTLPIFGG